MTEQKKRQPAYMLDISEIIRGIYTKNEGWNPSFITTSFGMKASRCCVFGTIIEEGENYINIDDTTGIITIRGFDYFKPFEHVKNGDFVMIIGKIRSFNEQNYIAPEICKKLEPNIIKYKNSTIAKLKKLFSTGKIKQDELILQTNFSSGKEVIQDIVEEAIEKTSSNNNSLLDEIMNFIDEKDTGQGVEKVKILDNFDNTDVIDAMDSLIMEGDIFEIKPGVFKVLK